MRFCQPITNITAEITPLATTISQGLYGEHVEVVEHLGRVVRIRNIRDDYQGIVPLHALSANNDPSTHFVCVAATFLFVAPDIKSPEPTRILFGSELVIVGHVCNQFAQTDTGMFALIHHCLPMGSIVAQDPVTFAEQNFIGVPYLWGGRSVDGFDCSGLLQLSAFAAGVLLPRDSAPQESFIGADVTAQTRQRGDIVFWPGHVGLMVDETRLLHATAHTMLSCVEPLEDVVTRAGAASSCKRL